MNYVYDITTPKDTAEASPAIRRERIATGRVVQIVVYFPSGNAGLHHLKVLWGNHQLWPTNPDADFSGDNIHIVLPEDWDIPTRTVQLTLQTWNEDDTFAHRVTFMITVLTEDTPPRWVVEIFKALAQTSAPSKRSLLAATGGVWSTLSRLFKLQRKQ